MVRVLALLVLLACASGPPLTPDEKIAEALVNCAKSGPCMYVVVDNGGWHRAAIRINGVKIGEVEGYDKQQFLVRQAILRNGHCATASAYLIGPAETIRSEDTAPHESCLLSGQYFKIDITNNQTVIWITPFNWTGPEA